MKPFAAPGFPRRSLPIFLASLWLLAGQALAPPLGAAEPGLQMGLNQAIQKALAYSPNLQASKEDLDAARLTRSESQTGFLPSLNTNYKYIGLKHVNHTRTALGVASSGHTDTYQWTSSISQPIFTGFNLLSTFRLADLDVDVAQAQVRSTMLDLVLAVKEAYFDFLRAQKVEIVTHQAVVQLNSHHQTAKDFYEVGIIPINDVLKVEVELANAQQEEVRAQNVTSVARAKLNSLLGLPVDNPLEVQDILNFYAVDIDCDQARHTARLERPELTSLDLKLLQADQSIIQAQSRFFPQVNLVAVYIFTSDRPALGHNDYYDPTQGQIMTQVNWTFWEWGRTHYQVGQRRAQKRRLENISRDLQDQVDLQVKQNYLGLVDSKKNIVTAEASIRSAIENFRITEARFKEQLTTNTEVLDAQTLLTQARNNYFTALTQYNVAEARLRRAMGGGVPEGVEPPPESLPSERADLNPLAAALSAPRPEKP
ncbi:outer membrane protein [Desulfarculales bacterium]